MGIKLDFHPSLSILDNFSEEMKTEFMDNGHRGLFGNFSIISDLFKNDKAIVCLKNGTPIGFTTWSRYNKTINIDLTWFLPSERNFYSAKRFLDLVAKEFKRRRDHTLKSSCVTLNGLCIAIYSGFHIEDGDIYTYIRNEYKYESGNVQLRNRVNVIRFLD